MMINKFINQWTLQSYDNQSVHIKLNWCKMKLNQ